MRELTNPWMEIAAELEGKTEAELEQLGFTQEEIDMITIYTDPVKWAAAHLDWHARDYQYDILHTIVSAKKTVLRLGRRLGKCLPGWVKIFDPETGRQVTIQELYERKQASVATMTDDLKITKTNTTQVWDNGIKEVFRVRLKSGKYIDATGNHPLYRLDGWVDIDNIKVGDFVATPSALPYFGNQRLNDAEVILLAYILGDGNCCNGNLRFSDNIEKVINELGAVCSHFDCELKNYESALPHDYAIIKRDPKSKENPIRNILRKHGIWGKTSLEKSIPESIMQLPKSQIALFLSRLFATDGWATSTTEGEARIEIGYGSSSEELIYGVQHLLLRFGIQSQVVKRKVKYQEEYRESYQLGIYRAIDVMKFSNEIGIYGKEDAINRAHSVASSMNTKSDVIPVEIMDEVDQLRIKRGLTNSDMVREIGNENKRYRKQYAPQKDLIHYWGHLLDSNRLKNIGSSDIYWDEVVSIESIGFHQTYDLTIPVTHNFVANDIIVHNTECMCIAIWWHAMLQPNKGPNNQYDILIITPYETQIDLIFKRLKEMLDMSPELKASVKRDVHHQIELKNGTVIKGLTAGTKNSSGAANTRGQRADVIILDEVDYMNEDDITNVQNIQNEAPERIKIISASTPSGRRASFYRWCVGAPSNGWRECYAPSTVNPELLKMNPDTNRTYLEDLKEELTELRYTQEVMAEFGEEAAGVYLKKHVDAAVELGKTLQIEYKTGIIPHRGPRILGVDWDKYGSATNMVGVEYISEFGVFSPFCREEIPRSEFTYDNAIKKIIELDAKYNFDYIYVDAGHGEMQIEQLRLYGMQHPETGLHKKIVRVNFSEKVTVRDPITKIRDKKDIKPFMVNNTVLLFERGQFAFNPADKTMIKQFEDYHIARFGLNGRPVYTDENEHIHDCVILAIHGFTMKYNDLLKVRHASMIARVDAFKRTKDNVVSRDMDKPEEEVDFMRVGKGGPVAMLSGLKYVGMPSSRRSSYRRPMSTFTRKKF